MKNRTYFIAIGHIDHGKSTFIGRLLLEMGAIPIDRFENLKSASQNTRLEYSHLTDALKDEKQKGITIGVSQTIFNYQNNEYVFIDAPGHHEFLQNMITGASKADIAFLIIDIKEGIKESTLRHLQMLSFLDITEVIVIVNKMDLVEYSEQKFESTTQELKSYFQKLSLNLKSIIPVSAYNSENLISKSDKMPWYNGPFVTQVLTQKAGSKSSLTANTKNRFIVHDVFENAVMGELISGHLQDGHEYFVAQTKSKLTVQLHPAHYRGRRIQSFFSSDLNLTLKRGDIITDSADGIRTSDKLRVLLIWFSSDKLKINDLLRLRLAKQESGVQITKVFDLIDSSTLGPVDPESDIQKGHVVSCEIQSNTDLYYDLFCNDFALGRFVLLKNGLISGAGKIIE